MMNNNKQAMVQFFMGQGLSYENALKRVEELENGAIQPYENKEIEDMTDTELQKQIDLINENRFKRLEYKISKEKAEVDSRLDTLETDVNKRMTIDYGQQQALLNAKNVRVEYLWRNDMVNKEIHDTKRKVHARAWTDLKNAFGVSSYKDTREKDFEEAINYMKSWRPRLI